ncbi:GNAT family N-acetyltransferase [Labrenzia sp. VG12]|uniref:GNAT family N-acetyltransferase n=1 Tax=Labrenzia sp. VG12 TaxID=2021862 RepID=UPI0012FDFC75|nr:GNAT family N-acetyltransferase [Labrenzia sp. VG12]
MRELENPTLTELNELWATLQQPVQTPFQTPAFLHALKATHCRGHNTVLSVISFSNAHQAKQPVMLLPLLRYRRGPLRVLEVPDCGLADQTAPVLDASAGNAADGLLPKAIQAYFSELDDIDLIDVKKLHYRVCGLNNPLFAQSECVLDSQTRRLDLFDDEAGGSWRRKAIYKKVRSKYRKLTEMGVVFEEATTPTERLSLFSVLAGQRCDRFRKLGREDSLQREERASFYRSLAEMETLNSPYRAFALRHGHHIVAALVLMKSETQATPVLISIGDDKWHSYSPGMVLFAKVIEWASEEGVRWFSFGTGEQDYKQRFGGEPLDTRRLLKPLSARGKLFLRAREAHHTAHEVLKIAVGRNRDGE